MFSQDDVVFVYTRAEAIADGVQVELSEKFPEACSAFKTAVFCTARVWELIESAVENPKTGNNFNGVIADICFVAATAIKRNAIAQEAPKDRIEFSVIITGSSIKPDEYEGGSPLYQLVALCGPMDFDDPSPAITIAFPDED